MRKADLINAALASVRTMTERDDRQDARIKAATDAFIVTYPAMRDAVSDPRRAIEAAIAAALDAADVMARGEGSH